MGTAVWYRYLYLTDGARFQPLLRVAVRPTGVEVVDIGTVAASRALPRGGGIGGSKPPLPEVCGELGPPEEVHGYRSVARRAYTTGGLARLVGSSAFSRPSKLRPGPIVDLQQRPPDARFLELEVGVRCPPGCHAAEDVLVPSRRFLRDATFLGPRGLVISASWIPRVHDADAPLPD